MAQARGVWDLRHRGCVERGGRGIDHLCLLIQAKVFDLEEEGAVPNDSSLATCWKNGGVFNDTLSRLQSGDTVVLPNATFYMMGGSLVNVASPNPLVYLEVW